MGDNHGIESSPKTPESVIQDNYDDIYKFCFWKVRNTVDAQDITQEVFYRFINNYDRYQENGKVKAYLYTIARNLCINFQKHKSKYSASEMHDELQTPDTVNQSIMKIDLDRIICKLPEKQQEIILLRYGQELSVEEIAKILHTNRFAVYYQIKLALQKLRQFYEGR